MEKRYSGELTIVHILQHLIKCNNTAEKSEAHSHKAV